ncbi:histone-lysine N-methyltransferase 2A isoform X2 [Tachysurus vachellii]|uniref:histone-lysine N-methyltransferase 2A isoform X2 n=1 Tax=Tachysurus vachellii TaxID=175792 RepID=UPI00296AEDEE|nr:histone-lysine N-methyltransferase 2A isoform X2 [Tachysurus vachellii]
MAHSCRWRFPARPGGSSNSGTGRKAGRIRVTASLRNGAGTHSTASKLGPGFDAALQVSTAIRSNLQKFRDVLGESSGSSSGSSSSAEEDAFEGFDTVIENGRVHSPGWTPTAKLSQEKKPRGRPPRCSTLQKLATRVEPHPLSVITTPPTEKIKRPPGRPPGSGEKRRGRPPASGNQRTWLQGGQLLPSDSRDVGLDHNCSPSLGKDIVDDDIERKAAKRTPLGSVQEQESEDKLTKVGRDSNVTKLKRMRDVKVKPLKSGLLKGVPVPFVPRRRRGRPPSAERLKAEIAAASLALELSPSESGTAKHKTFGVRLEEDMDPGSTQHPKLRDSHSADQHTTPDSPDSESVVNPTTPPKHGSRLGLRQSPRHIKPVRTVPPSKRTDATIAKQLLQRAKKGARKKKLEAAGTQGAAAIESGIRKRTRTQLKNIRQFIMPVVSTVSLRIIKTPKRFIEDEFSAPPPHMKIARIDSTVPAPVTHPSTTSSTLVSTAPSTTGTAAVSGAGPPVDTFPPPPPPAPPANATVATGSLISNNSCNSNGRFSSSAASCGSSAVSQHSFQLSSGESSRSSSPSLDDSSCDSQISDGTQVLSEEPDHSPSSQGEREASLHHSPRPLSPPSEPETEHMELMEPNRRGRRGQGLRRGNFVSRGRSNLISNRKRAIISPATGVMMSSSQAGSQQASSTASSSSSPPPPPTLLTPPQPPQSASSNVSAISEHHPHSSWIMPHPIAPFLPNPPIIPGSHDKRRAILREPTFRWTSLSRIEQQYFSSAKYAKEGLIRKPIFDNFRPPPLTAEDVGLMPPGPGGGGVATGGFPASGGTTGAGTRLFSLHHHHHQHPSSRFETPLQKRSPLLRAPRFTPSAAHSRIFESVTLPSSSGSSPSSQSPLQSTPPSNRLPRHRRRRTFGHSRIQSRSPSHSMTTRSSQSGAQSGKGSAELSALTSSVPTSVTGNSSPIPGIAVSPVAPSALPQAPFNTFSSSSLGPNSHRASDVRRVDVTLGGGVSSASSSSQLFPRFASSPQGSSGSTVKLGRERSVSTSRDTLPKEKDRETERSKVDRGKENKKEAKKDWEKRGKSLATDSPTNSTSSLFAVDGKDVEETFSQKKTIGQKKSVSVESGAETPSADTNIIQPTRALLSKGRVSKKGRLPEKGMEADEMEKNKERSATLVPPIHSRKLPSTPSLGSMLALAEKQPATDRRVAGLLKKAKAQLFNIEKSKSLKTVDQPKVQGQESDSSEASVRGPRIKHVCRRAAVALGRNRAVFPDDMPTLSALPWEEREKILSSMGNDDKSSVAGSEEAEPASPPLKPVTRHKTVQEATPRKGRRSRRCGQCPGCQVPEDCGKCANCLDKPKFGGRNIKKQCCKERKCQNLQWMPSKMFLQKQAKGKKDKKKSKVPEKKEAHHSVKPQCSEVNLKSTPAPSKDDPPVKKSDTPPPVQEEDTQKQHTPSPPPSSSSPDNDPPLIPSPEDTRHLAPSSVYKKDRKLSSPLSRSPHTTASTQPPEPSQDNMQQQTQTPAKKEGPTKSPSIEPKKKPQQHTQPSSAVSSASDAKQIKKQAVHCGTPPKPKPKEKEKQMVTKPDRSTLNFLSTPSIGGTAKQKAPSDGVHRISVDFKEDFDIEKVWEMGGLSILTSVPITPQVVCFLCASSGNVEFVFCQVCCEPFHIFCLGETERPLNEEWENWCCRRCRFCHVCGHQHQKNKELLDCDKCRNSFHPECLGPNYPTRPTKKRIWVCTKCVCCKSCGATKPGKTWDAQWSHDFSLCHDCAKRFAKGNFCPLCNKCYDDDYENKMMPCGKCNHWVHAKCEKLTDEMYELLSRLPKNAAYTCVNCTEHHPPKWRTALEKDIQSSMRQVLTALLNSRTSTHLLHYRQVVMKPPELNPETEESLPSRRSPEGPDPPLLTEVSLPSDSPLDLASVEKKMNSGHYRSVLDFSDDIVRIVQTSINLEGGQPESRKANSMVKSFFIRQMERVFPWFNVKESKFWEAHKVSYNGLLPNAVLPPSLDHNYAQWQEREDMACAEHHLSMKIIPAPCSRAPGEPDFPIVPPPPPPQLMHDLSQEESPELPLPSGIGDNRQCVLCLNYGDQKANECGRLLYIFQNEWAHVNCALWSVEVFEDDDGSLKNVHMAVSRGRQLHCENCQKPGATVGCCLTSCSNNYHFMCARQCHCAFLEDKKVYCQRHRDLVKGEVLSDTGFEVTRRILVDFEGITLRRKFLHGLKPDNVHMMIGSMTIDCLGMLTELSDCERKLFPIGYQCSRVYWSTLDARKRCVYTCRILACRPLVADNTSNSIVMQENNCTIAHSPPLTLEETNSSLSPDSVSVDHNILPMIPKSRVYFRNRHPSYPPCHLPSPGAVSSAHEIVTVGNPLLNTSLSSIGSRRHSTSSLSHQKPRQKISSGPQGSSLFSQIQPVFPSPATTSQNHGGGDSVKGKAFSDEKPQCRETTVVKNIAQYRPVYGYTERFGGGRVTGKKPNEGDCLKSAPSAVLTSPPLGTAVLTGHQRGCDSMRIEKGKQVTKDTDLPAGATLLSCSPFASDTKDNGVPGKEAVITAVTESKDIRKTGSPQAVQQKTGGRKSHNCLSGPSPAAALKPLWTPGVITEEDIKRGTQANSSVVASHVTPSTKEKPSKVKLTEARGVSKERKEVPQNSKAQILNSNSSSSKGSNIKTQAQLSSSQNNTNKGTAVISNKTSGSVEMTKSHNQRGERQLKSRERFSTGKKHSSAVEAIQSAPGPPFVHSKSREESVPVEKHCTERLSIVSQKMDPNGNKSVNTCSNTNTSTSRSHDSHDSQRKCSHTMIFSPFASSESSESDSHTLLEEQNVDHQCAEDDGDGADHHLEDESSPEKHHEEDSDGSTKRRYPRRSARARSNMFFGLTPFYGVRSYGEEDIPFYSSGDIPIRKRSGGSKRSAEGQVDGADDMSTSSSADSGEDEEGFGPNKDSYYYNFRRTIINHSSSFPSIEAIDQCLGRRSQIHRFMRDGAKETDDESDEIAAATKSLECQQIGQLDGVDDDSESDASVNTSSTTTATTSTTHKNSVKKRVRESRAEKLNADSGKETENTTGDGSTQNRDVRKNQKDNCLQLGTVKSQGQDPLENQLSLSADLLKSDSDNNNSDDCNILPSDIMEFVLNTPSMQSLGQQPEANSTEPFSLDEGYGVDVNRRKTILFEDYTPPLASTEPVESGVSTSIPVEEPFGLPLELPSDLSVLTTRSPSVNNQNHGSLISESSERNMLTLATEESGVEKGGDKKRAGSAVSSESPRDDGDSQATEGDMTPDHFISAHIDGDHISSHGINQVTEAGNPDLNRTSGTPGLPSSPTVASQGQKFIPSATVSTGHSQIVSPAVQSTHSPLKAGPEKLIVLNQHLRPLYVLQTLPNGVTQKIQIAPSVNAAGVMNSSAPVLTGISAGISPSQSIFPAVTKGLVPVPHHPQLHAFTSTTQTGFQSIIPSTTSGLFIGVPSHDHQIIASEAGHRHDLAPSVAMVSSASSISPTPTVLATGHGKKRPISRLQPRKSKKLARSRSQPTLAPSEVGPNMTLINLSTPQIATGIPAQPGLVELGTITTAAATSHRKMPNIIKRSKSGVVYIEPALLPQPMPISTAAQAGIIGHDSSTHLLPCTVAGLNPNQSLLNVVSMPPTAPGNLLGANSVSLSTPGLISSEITGPISNLVFKASHHNLGLPEQQMVLQSGTPMVSQITSPAQTPIASSICVLPPNQISMSPNQHQDKEGSVVKEGNFQTPITKLVADKTSDHSTNISGHVALVPSHITHDFNKGHLVGVSAQSSQTSSISQAISQQQTLKSPTAKASPCIGKVKQKAKRTLPSVASTGGKKHKGPSEILTEPPGVPDPANQSSLQRGKEHMALELTNMAKSNEKGSRKSNSRKCEPSSLNQKAIESHDEKFRTASLSGQNSDQAPNALMITTPNQKDNGQNSTSDYKPKKGLLFEICSDDGFKVCCESIEEAWKSLTDKVQEARCNAKLKELSFDGVNGLRMLGVVHDAVAFLLEQLYGARYCRNYRFRFHKPEDVDEPPLNPHGSARADVHYRRSVMDMFNFLASKYRQPPEYSPQEEEDEEQFKSARRSTSTDVPLAARFRYLKKTSKDSVGVYRSSIHGRGLFCKRNIDAGEMVIEYSGNVIRSVLTDKREKYYDAKGIGCYMFRIDDYEVVDATMHGNSARFINHSCEPNCYSRVVNIDGQKHIVIFALRKIYMGEELTYDYKFPIEEPGNKLPCNCGAKKCRKFLN